MAWASTRGNARNAHAYLRTTPAKQHREVRGRHLGVPHHQERHAQPAVTAGGCGAAPADLALATRTRRGPGRGPGPRGAASLWDLFPAGPSSSTLAPSPPGRPGLMGPARNPELVNAPAATQN